MNRRQLLSFAGPVAGAAFLAGCATMGGGTAGVPTLAQAQTWATDVVNALAALGQDVLAQASGLPAGTAAAIQIAETDAQTALAALLAVTPATDARTVAVEVITAVQKLVPLLPLPQPLGIAVQTGLAVLLAFAQSFVLTVPPVPATLRRAAARYHRRA